MVEKFSFFVIASIGWILAKTPAVVVAWGCRAGGWLTWHFSSRRRTICSGLSRAFPDRDPAWVERTAKANCARLLEMFLLVLALPHWSERRQRTHIRVDDSVLTLMSGPARERPMVFLVPHGTMTEATGMIPFLIPEAPPIVTLYRPLDFPAAERYVHRARETWGVKLVARREGLLFAKGHLQSGAGVAGILFDQSAGMQGHLMLFFNRICSTTNLPGLLASKTGALPVLVRTRRDGFWRGTIEAHPLPAGGSPAEIMSHAHAALEKLLREDDEACTDWFWAHKRWKGTLRPHQLLSVPSRKSYLREQMAQLGLRELPRTTRFVLRLDPRPEILPAAFRLVHLLRQQRRDAQLWLLVPPALAKAELPAHDRRLDLPADPEGRRAFLRALDREFPDALFVLDNSREATAEGRLLACELRVGISQPGAARRVYHRTTTVTDEAYRKKPFAAWRQLATQLGLTDAQLTEAMRTFGPATPGKPSSPPT